MVLALCGLYSFESNTLMRDIYILYGRDVETLPIESMPWLCPEFVIIFISCIIYYRLSTQIMKVELQLFIWKFSESSLPWTEVSPVACECVYIN